MGVLDFLKKKYESVDVNEINDIKGAKIIDVRTRPEYNTKHIIGAKNIVLDDIIAGKANLDKRKKYYVVCQSGNRSASACKILSENGYEVVNLKGGMSAYRH